MHLIGCTLGCKRAVPSIVQMNARHRREWREFFVPRERGARSTPFNREVATLTRLASGGCSLYLVKSLIDARLEEMTHGIFGDSEFSGKKEVQQMIRMEMILVLVKVGALRYI